MTTKKFGKVTEVRCGLGGYQDAQIGIGFTLGGDSWGVSTPFYGAWATEITENTQWTEEGRIKVLGETFIKIKQWCEECKIMDISELKGKPVEITLENMRLKEWRFLTEVI